ncbi:hypothetical protein PGT21_025927 [Puccinia graminis f. sp. tritici]|uniref:Uncharacterized protein n=1 Tax=Puccinia graminis f. sp. tritici TaxID=56615 RepID=A0A5B0P8S5_PUCGR|nr:hypothetical protein PGT21_025927 [Puccinia graminis f. sp. tritici]
MAFVFRFTLDGKRLCRLISNRCGQPRAPIRTASSLMSRWLESALGLVATITGGFPMPHMSNSAGQGFSFITNRLSGSNTNCSVTCPYLPINPQAPLPQCLSSAGRLFSPISQLNPGG